VQHLVHLLNNFNFIVKFIFRLWLLSRLVCRGLTDTHGYGYGYGYGSRRCVTL